MHADKSQWVKRFPLFRRLSEIIWWVSMISMPQSWAFVFLQNHVTDMIPRSCFDICTQAFRNSFHNDSFLALAVILYAPYSPEGAWTGLDDNIIATFTAECCTIFATVVTDMHTYLNQHCNWTNTWCQLSSLFPTKKLKATISRTLTPAPINHTVSKEVKALTRSKNKCKTLLVKELNECQKHINSVIVPLGIQMSVSGIT